MIRSSSNGGTTAAPIFSAISRATVSRVAEVIPALTTSAPYARVASTFDCTEFSGMTIVAGMPRSLAARATPWAWFPEEKATTPRRRWSSSSCRSAFIAPRILNDPARCRFSHFRRTSTPILSERERLERRGVRWTQGRMRSAAERTSAKSIPVLTFGELTRASINSRRLFDFLATSYQGHSGWRLGLCGDGLPAAWFSPLSRCARPRWLRRRSVSRRRGRSGSDARSIRAGAGEGMGAQSHHDQQHRALRRRSIPAQGHHVPASNRRRAGLS